MKLYKEDSDFAKSPIIIIVESIIIFLLMSLLVFMSNPRKHISYKNKNLCIEFCKSNIRLLKSAIKKYNSESNNSMQRLDQFKLLEKNYIKKIIIRKPNDDCYYFSYGDLTKDGIVYCDFHGDIEGKKIEQNCSQEKENYLKYLDDLELKRKTIYYVLIIYIFTIPLLHLIIHMIFNMKKSILGIIFSIIYGLLQAVVFFLLIINYDFYLNY